MKKIKKIVRVGNLEIGGLNPVAIQSMTTTKTQDIKATVNQILALEKSGCEIVRVAVPDMASALAIKEIKKEIHIPLVADIHFDYRLAIEAINGGIDKIRINPGNIGERWKVKEIVDRIRDKNIPIRIGVNSGSVETYLIDKYKGPTPEAMVESAINHINILEDLNYDKIVLSLKSSDVLKTIRAYELMHEKSNYPLHLGVTEAGTLIGGTVKSALGIGHLLLNGIGDTLRVSLSADPVEEIKVAKMILQDLDMRLFGVKLISCPTCGRTNVNIIDIANKIESALEDVKKPITVAVMGCIVNGPGEAREADIGIAGGIGEALLFKKGKAIRKIKEENIISELLMEIDKL
ncbi:MAG: flavodoxin-dependent (E)-4-hydroxy-3-methylbut-2-enyl-diphosphate synthase [Clostridiales bacterium]|nr:flavodoxin-dependent (E)-4-hydroxy-3-methylbut-2-enyl-diphosphate synthase [Clostridiales bacterium]